MKWATKENSCPLCKKDFTIISCPQLNGEREIIVTAKRQKEQFDYQRRRALVVTNHILTALEHGDIDAGIISRIGIPSIGTDSSTASEDRNAVDGNEDLLYQEIEIDDSCDGDTSEVIYDLSEIEKFVDPNIQWHYDDNHTNRVEFISIPTTNQRTLRLFTTQSNNVEVVNEAMEISGSHPLRMEYRRFMRSINVDVQDPSGESRHDLDTCDNSCT